MKTSARSKAVFLEGLLLFQNCKEHFLLICRSWKEWNAGKFVDEIHMEKERQEFWTGNTDYWYQLPGSINHAIKEELDKNVALFLYTDKEKCEEVVGLQLISAVQRKGAANPPVTAPVINKVWECAGNIPGQMSKSPATESKLLVQSGCVRQVRGKLPPCYSK